MFWLRLRLFFLVALCLANGVAMFIKNIAILINLLTFKCLGIALNNLAYDTALKDDIAFSIDDAVGKIFEGSSGLGGLFLKRFGAANDLASVVPDFAFGINLLASQLLRITFDQLANRSSL